MFYSSTILWYRTPLGKVWNVAHRDKKLKRKQVENVNLDEIVVQILHPAQPLSLRTSSMLMLGVVRIYAAKIGFLKRDVEAAARAAARAKSNIDLPSAPKRLVPLTELPKVNLDELFGGLGGIVRYVRPEEDEPLEGIDSTAGQPMESWIQLPAEWLIAPMPASKTSKKSTEEGSSTTSGEPPMVGVAVPPEHRDIEALPSDYPDFPQPEPEAAMFEDAPIGEIGDAPIGAEGAVEGAVPPSRKKQRFAVVNASIQIDPAKMKALKDDPSRFFRVKQSGPTTREEYEMHMEQGMSFEARWTYPSFKPFPGENDLSAASRMALEEIAKQTLPVVRRREKAVRARAGAAADLPDMEPPAPMEHDDYPPPVVVDDLTWGYPLPEVGPPEEPEAKRRKVTPASVVEPNVLTVRRTAERMDQVFKVTASRRLVFQDVFVKNKTSRYQAEAFFDLCVLATHGKVNVDQKKAKGDITVTPTDAFTPLGLPESELASVMGTAPAAARE